MKKIVLILIVSLIAFLPACTQAPENETEHMDYGEEIGLYYDNLYEYSLFITEGYNPYGLTVSLPDNFVYWDDISFFGTFVFLRLDLDCRTGYYAIKDEQGVDFLLYLDFEDGKQSWIQSEEYTTVNVAENMTSMRKSIEYGKHTKIVRNGFEYRYDPWGDFSGIVWYENGVEYHLYDSDFVDYPLTTDTLIGKLLSLDNTHVENATTQIRQSLTK